MKGAKKVVYIAAWILLGFLLAVIAHAGIEIPYIYYAVSQNLPLTIYPSVGHATCYLPVWLQSFVIAVGVVGGYYAGVYFWQVLYVEKRYRKWGRLGKWRNINLKQDF